jgi:hypothetical protein
MNDNDYKDLINLMKATPKAPVPDNFTQNVMERIALLQPNLMQRVGKFFLQPRGPLYDLRNLVHNGITRNQCSLCLATTALFYLCFGIFLFFRLPGLQHMWFIPIWIQLQPAISVVVFSFLILSSLFLVRKGEKSMPAIGSIIFAYLGFVFANGAGMYIGFRNALITPVIIGFIMYAIIIFFVPVFIFSYNGQRKLQRA